MSEDQDESPDDTEQRTANEDLLELRGQSERDFHDLMMDEEPASDMKTPGDPMQPAVNVVDAWQRRQAVKASQAK